MTLLETYENAVSRYKAEAGENFKQPDEGQSVCRGGAWFLADEAGQPVALVTADGVLHGIRLRQWYASRHNAAEQIQNDVATVRK